MGWNCKFVPNNEICMFGEKCADNCATICKSAPKVALHYILIQPPSARRGYIAREIFPTIGVYIFPFFWYFCIILIELASARYIGRKIFPTQDLSYLLFTWLHISHIHEFSFSLFCNLYLVLLIELASAGLYWAWNTSYTGSIITSLSHILCILF